MKIKISQLRKLIKEELSSEYFQEIEDEAEWEAVKQKVEEELGNDA